MTAPKRLLGNPTALFGDPVSTCPDYQVYAMPPPIQGIQNRNR
jgi:hypothetical protein